MCNSWNHSYDCRSGFGGEGHLGRNYGSKSLELNFFSCKVSYESYVIPNAKCPVCGDKVFFYQSPYGGKVFFDELGYPWTKHPCTDNTVQNSISVNNYPFIKAEDAKILVDNLAWKKQGWEPFTCWKAILDYELQKIKLVGYLSKYSEKIVEQRFPWGRGWGSEHRIICTDNVPLLTLYLNGLECWLQNKFCVFIIYPTFIRKNSQNENQYEISSFKLNSNNQLSLIHFKNAYLSKACQNDFIAKGEIMQRKRVQIKF